MPIARLALVALVALPLAAAPARAADNEVPSCYQANKLPVPAAPLGRAIFVLVDQTTLLDDKLKNSVLQNLWDFLGANSAYTVATFSAFAQGRYTEVTAAGIIEPPFPEKERNATGVKLLASFDQCIQGQLVWARKRATQLARAGMDGASDKLSRSEIMAALKDISARVKASPARDKVLFVVSDMLENSSITSFYGPGGRVRQVDPAKELGLARKASVLGDFGGARVFVLGAGIIGPAGDAQGSYRDTRTMSALAEFWRAWFDGSSARLEQFGMPALLQAVRPIESPAAPR